MIACDEELKEDPIEVEQSSPVEESSSLPDESYDRENYSFNGTINLAESLFVRARHVQFKAGSAVKINSHTLSIEADTVTFEGNSSVLAFNPTEYASCKKNGSNSGMVEVTANIVSGVPTVDLAGQNAGQIGIYNGTRVLEPIDKSHEVWINKGEVWYKGCITYVKGKYPKDVPELFEPKHGGKPGAFLVSSNNYEDFKPLISNRVAHGSYEALVEGSTRKISWWRTAAKGSDSQSGEVCFDISGEYLCK